VDFAELESSLSVLKTCGGIFVRILIRYAPFCTELPVTAHILG
jgi:hypothetical protein